MDLSDDRAKIEYALHFIHEARSNGLINHATFLRLRAILEKRKAAVGGEARTAELVEARTPSAAAMAPPPKAIPARPLPEEIRVAYAGARYQLGFGAGFYGVWDGQASGEPVERFEGTPEGWREAWLRFVQIEPNPKKVIDAAPPRGAPHVRAPVGPAAVRGRPTPQAKPAPTPFRPDRPRAPVPSLPGPPPRRPAWVAPPSPTILEPVANWTRRARALVVSDFALHGLAYLGVLLLFAGAFGLMFFSFSEVRRDLRPLAEIAIPGVLFGSAGFLRRRKAPLVARGMEILGGALLPVVVFASFVDGASVPPDVTRGTLIAMLTMASLALAGGYAAWTVRDPSTPLRYLVGPLVWTAFLAIGFVFKSDEPVIGIAIERPVAMQLALATVAVPITLLPALRWRKHRLAEPALLAAVPGAGLAYILTILVAVGHGWPSAPLVLAGLGALASCELLAVRFGARQALPILEPLLVGTTIAALTEPWGIAGAGVVAFVAYLGLLELELRRTPAGIGPLLSVTGMAAGLAMSLADPWMAVGAWSLASGWAHVRRVIGLKDAEKWLSNAAALLPLGVAYGLLRALPDAQAWAVLAVGVVAGSGAVRAARTRDFFWAWWLPGAALAIGAGTWVTAQAQPDFIVWELPVAAGLAGLALALAPRWAASRVWMTGSVVAACLALAFDAAGLPRNLEPSAWVLAALVTLVVASVWRSRTAGHVAAVGTLAAAGAIAAPSSGACRVTVLAAWTALWLVTVVSHELAGAPLIRLIERAIELLPDPLRRWIGRVVSVIPPVALLASTPFLVLAWARRWEAFADHRAWGGVALALTALVYAACARVLIRRRPLAAWFAGGAFALSAVAVGVAAPVSWPTTEAVAASIAVVVLIGGELRRPAMNWFAWAMSGVLVILLANRAGVHLDSMHLVTLGWGVILLIGGLAFDDIHSGRREAGEGLRVRWLTQPVALGALAVPLSLAPVFVKDPAVFGWWSLAAAAFYLVVAAQVRIGLVSAVAYALDTVAFAALLPWPPLARPWIFSPEAGALVATSLALRRASRGPDPMLRWDLPPLLIAHAVAAVALSRSLGVGFVPATWASFGALSLAVGLVGRKWAWTVAGTALVLVGAGAAGPGWLAGALAATSLGTVVAAVKTSGWVRRSLQAGGVIAAGWTWGETIVAANWPRPGAVAATSLAAGALALAIGGATRFTRLSSEWALPWGGLSVVGVVVAGAATGGAVDGMLPAAGTALFGAGAALAARPLGLPWLRPVAVGSLGWAWAETAIARAWSPERIVAWTSLASGGLSALVGAGLRLKRPREWAIPLLGLATLGMVAVAAQSPSHIVDLLPTAGTLLFAGGTAMAVGVLGWEWLAGVTVGAVGWGWGETILGLAWPVDVSFVGTAVLSGAIVLGLGSALRMGRIPRHWAASWIALGTGGMVAVALAVRVVEPRPGGLGLAIGSMLSAAGVALAARSVPWPWLRESAALLGLGSLASLGYGMEATPTGWAIGAIAVGFAAVVGSVAVWRARVESPWLQPLAVVGVIASMLAIVMASSDWPERDLLVAAVIVAGVEAAAAGLALRLPSLLGLSPPLLCAGWLLFASEALTNDPQWYTVPIGLTLLVLVEIARWARRTSGQDTVSGDLLALEYLGIAFLVGASLAETIARHPAFGLLGVLFGAGVMGWGGLTRVRRRAAAGAAVALAAVALMIAAPVAQMIPTLHGATLWMAVGAIGGLLVLVATFLEQWRAQLKTAAKRLGELMEGWE